jgi:hypothetical protein
MTTAIAAVNPISTDHRPTDHRIVSRQQWLAAARCRAWAARCSRNLYTTGRANC